MPTRTPLLCVDNFNANEGDQVQWQNPVTNCTISQDGTNPFPFSSIPPCDPPNCINISPPPPIPVPKILVTAPASATPYTYVVSCCEDEQGVRSVTVVDT